VARFVPVQTERSIVRAKQIDVKKLTRWQRILTEAAEQSHRGRIPEITDAVTWNDALSQFGRFHRCLIAATSGKTVRLGEALGSADEPPTSVAVLIGPEGGFTDHEVEQACENGAVPVGLGPRILRTETAGMILPALILHEIGDWEP